MAKRCQIGGTRTREAADHEYAGLARTILRGLEAGYPVDSWWPEAMEYVTHVEHATAFFSEKRVQAAVEFLASSFDRGVCRWVEIGSRALRERYTRHILEDAALAVPEAFR